MPEFIWLTVYKISSSPHYIKTLFSLILTNRQLTVTCVSLTCKDMRLMWIDSSSEDTNEVEWYFLEQSRGSISTTMTKTNGQSINMCKSIPGTAIILRGCLLVLITAQQNKNKKLVVLVPPLFKDWNQSVW